MTEIEKAAAGTSAKTRLTAAEKQAGWRVSINLLDNTDFIISVPTRATAFGRIECCIAEGFVTVDRSTDRTQYNSTVYPLHQIKSFHVYEVGVEAEV